MKTRGLAEIVTPLAARLSPLARAVLPGGAGLCAALFLVSAQAAFQPVDDFEALTPGNIHGQNSWFDASNRGLVGLDPAGNGNQVLAVSTEPGDLYRAATVPQGASRLLFLRFRFEAHGAYSFGLSPAPVPADYSEFGPALGMAADAAGVPNNDLRAANGTTPGAYDVLETLTPDTWYNTWIMIDNSADTYQVWLNAEPGGNAASGDLLDNAAAETLFGFRAAGTADLVNFFIKTAGGSPTAGRFYVDDIYLEDSGALNLNNPVDSNGDGITDADAIALGLDPFDPAGDTDNDGQTDVIEVGGDVSSPLDSDADGVIDALETGTDATDASVASGLLLTNGARVSLATAPGEMLSQVRAAAVANGSAGINFPFGSISYITTSPLGGSVTVRMAFSADLPADPLLYKQDNGGLLTELPDSVWSQVDAATLDVILTDGSTVTDLDGASNGFIEDPVAPAGVTPVQAGANTSGGGCVLNRAAGKDPGLPLLVLALLGYAGFRRSRKAQEARD